MAESSVIKVGM